MPRSFPPQLSLLFLTLLSAITYQTHSIHTKNPFQLSNQNKYIPCSWVPHAIEAINNNSISSAIPDNQNMFVAVSQKNTQIYKFPIKKNNESSIGDSITEYYLRHNKKYTNAVPFQLLKECSGSSAVDFSGDGKRLAVGCSNGNTYLYVFDGLKYIFKQVLNNSYYKNGAKVALSSDGHYLITIESLTHVNVYILGSQLYQLSQKISANIVQPTILALTPNSSYFAIFDRNPKQFQVSLYTLNPQNSTYTFTSSQSLTRYITSLSLTYNFLSITIGAVTSPCQTLIYKIDPATHSLSQFQQIFQTDTKICIASSTITQRKQLILTNLYLTSFVYYWDAGKGRFQKGYDIYHEAMGEPIHTQIKREGDKYEHLLVYNGVELNIFCYGQQSNKAFQTTQ